MASRIWHFNDISTLSSKYPAIKQGCLVDTSILFAATYDPDKFNTDAVQLFDYLAELQIPLFANVNIRAEFLDQHRRVMIPEGLASMFVEGGSKLDRPLYLKLQSINTSMAEARRTGEAFKFNEDQIKRWREVIRQYSPGRIDGWEYFCTQFLKGYIEPIWDEAEEDLGIQFLSVREEDKDDWLQTELKWDDVASLVGRFGFGSFDAMIVNLFVNSKFAAIITADREIAYAIESLGLEDKFAIIPKGLSI
ncbi:MAG: hypothetical protein SGI74_02310 [Oligoflexia bacterium]|nr:hypothetical protein [Oligoflexia bacterium]